MGFIVVVIVLGVISGINLLYKLFLGGFRLILGELLLGRLLGRVGVDWVGI